MLSTALIEIAPDAGDLIQMKADTVTVRAIAASGTVCARKVISSQFWYGMASSSGRFAVNDSVHVYRVATDTWTRGVIAAVDTGAAAVARIPACQYGDSTAATAPVTRVAMRFTGFTDTLRVGAAVRSYQRTLFGLVNRGGNGWLVRHVSPDSAQALAGPLLPDSGIAFTYLDVIGVPTATAANVERVEILLRGLTRNRISGGVGHLNDSLRVMVRLRNR
jgi:hypothetical protein